METFLTSPFFVVFFPEQSLNELSTKPAITSSYQAIIILAVVIVSFLKIVFNDSYFWWGIYCLFMETAGGLLPAFLFLFSFFCQSPYQSYTNKFDKQWISKIGEGWRIESGNRWNRNRQQHRKVPGWGVGRRTCDLGGLLCFAVSTLRTIDNEHMWQNLWRNMIRRPSAHIQEPVWILSGMCS